MPVEKNIKYQQLIKSAKRLFNTYGLKKISIEEICRDAEVSKMTFYKFFKNKYSIAEYIYNDLVEKAWETYREIMSQNISFSGKVSLIIKMKADKRKEMGNPFIQDIISSGEFSGLLQNQMDKGMKEQLEFFNFGKKSGEIKKSMKPEFYFYILEHILAMLDDKSLEEIFPDISERIEHLQDFIFYGLFSKKTGGYSDVKIQSDENKILLG